MMYLEYMSKSKPTLTELRSRKLRNIIDSNPKILDSLTVRQREIAWLILRAKKNSQIASILKIETKTVSNHIDALWRRMNSPVQSEFKSSLALRRKSVASLHSRGYTSQEIAKHLDLPSWTVAQDLKYLKLKPNKSQPLSEDECWRIVRFTQSRIYQRQLARGLTLGQIAVSSGVSREYVLRDFVRLNISIPEGENWSHKDGNGNKIQWPPADRNR